MGVAKLVLLFSVVHVNNYSISTTITDCVLILNTLNVKMEDL